MTRIYSLYLSQLYAIRCLYAKSAKDNYSTAHSLSFFLCCLNLMSFSMVVDFFTGNFVAERFWGENMYVPKVVYGVLMGLIFSVFVSIVLRLFRKLTMGQKINVQRKVISNKIGLTIFGVCYLFSSIAFSVVGMNCLIESLFGEPWIDVSNFF